MNHDSAALAGQKARNAQNRSPESGTDNDRVTWLETARAHSGGRPLETVNDTEVRVLSVSDALQQQLLPPKVDSQRSS